jgi:Tol biopolymer transport system component
MGVVYRARDTRLNRDVAIKLLSEIFLLDPERVARFEREAQILAALNHPNIAAIYGLEESDGAKVLVLELVDGQSLAQKIEETRGSGLPLDESLRIARQVIDALEAAHEKGIVHRDLKPANIMVTAEGVVKVLDFGLAKVDAPAVSAAGAGVSQSPTLTFGATRAGVILGTAAYMSPEQAKGRTADKRSDIWGFGCVLYEMLAGKRAFAGEDISDTLACVLRGEPDWNALPAAVPAHVRTLLRRCLEKDRAARIADIAVARFVLDEGATLSSAAASPRKPSRQGWLAAFAASAVAAALALGFVVARRPASVVGPRPSPRVRSDLGADVSLVTLNAGASAVLSPDGTLLALTGSQAGGQSQLFVRRLDQLTALPLAGSEGAFSPFFSPDGQFVAFFADGKLKKVSVKGGGVVTLCDVRNGRGGWWGEDHTIVYSPDNAIGTTLMAVSADGGTPRVVTRLEGAEVTHRFPQLLNGGRAVLFMAHSATGSYANANLVVQVLPDGPRKIVVRDAFYGRYARSGHLLFVRQDSVLAAPFNLERLEVTGDAVPVLQDVTQGSGAGAQYALSDEGTLVYRQGDAASDIVGFEFLSRDGRTSALPAAASNWSNPAFSPDGHRVALDISSRGQVQIWTYEWERDRLTRLTLDAAVHVAPVWSPGGKWLAYASTAGTGLSIRIQRADGGSAETRLTDGNHGEIPGSWHPTGKYLAFTRQTPAHNDIMILPLDGSEQSGWTAGQPTPFLNTAANETAPAFSPDGRWLAYTSDESGASEVYVRPFPGPGGKWMVSNSSGNYASWSNSGRELFYSTNNGVIMSVAYRTEADSFIAEQPKVVPGGRATFRGRTGSSRGFAVFPDGTRVLRAPLAEASTDRVADKVVFVFNFFDELKRLVAAR